MVSEDDVRKIAKLAHLAVSDEDLKKYQNQLSAILGYVEQLNAIDVSAVEATTHVHGSSNIFRLDEIKPSTEPKEALRNAPDTSGQFFRVPIIMDA